MHIFSWLLLYLFSCLRWESVIVLFVCCIRSGTRAIAEILTSSLSSVDPHFTKTTLEHVERELCRHVSRLVAQSQVSPPAAPAQPRPMSISTEPVTGPSGLTVIGVEESSSSPSGQYATAVSLSSVEVDDQPASGNDVQETAIWHCRSLLAFIFPRTSFVRGLFESSLYNKHAAWLIVFPPTLRRWAHHWRLHFRGVRSPQEGKLRTKLLAAKITRPRHMF